MTSPTASLSVAGNLAVIRRRVADACASAGRDPASVHIIGASKTQPVELIRAAMDAGLSHFGENYVQDAEPKINDLRAAGLAATWRMIGHLQTNKIRRALELFDAIDTIDSVHLATAVGQRASRPVQVLIEVNLAEEASKTGCLPADLPAVVDAVDRQPHLDLRGLMTIAPLTDNPQTVRPVFARLRDLTARFGLPEVSMGMTDDFEVAIQEGSTMIRVGRAIFGARHA